MVFGLFRKKSMEDIMSEERLLDQKIEAQKAKVRAVYDRKKAMEKLARKKAALKTLQAAASDSTYRRIKSKTSPVIRNAEKAVARNLPKILNKIGEASVKGGAAMSSGGFGSSGGFSLTPPAPKKKRKTNPLEVRLW